MILVYKNNSMYGNRNTLYSIPLLTIPRSIQIIQMYTTYFYYRFIFTDWFKYQRTLQGLVILGILGKNVASVVNPNVHSESFKCIPLIFTIEYFHGFVQISTNLARFSHSWDPGKECDIGGESECTFGVFQMYTTYFYYRILSRICSNINEPCKV
jgi:hypothetical protein